MKALILDFCRSNSPGIAADRSEDSSAEILLITGILTDESLLVKNKFHALLQQKDISAICEKRLKKLSLKKRQFVYAKSPETFAEEIRYMIEEADTLVFWNRNSHETLRDFFHTVGLNLCNHEVIILQDEIRTANLEISEGLKSILMYLKINIQGEKLESPLVRIRYLLRLFRLLSQTGILKKGITEKLIIKRMHSYDSLYGEMIGDAFGVYCKAEEGVFHIQTDIASWIIYHEDGKILQVYHENVDYRLNMKSKTMKAVKTIPEFHCQDTGRVIGEKTMFNMIQYIKHHDLRSIEIVKERAM